jgi:micrococcal nuclease
MATIIGTARAGAWPAVIVLGALAAACGPRVGGPSASKPAGRPRPPSASRTPSVRDAPRPAKTGGDGLRHHAGHRRAGGAGDRAVVTRVIDGDTLEVSAGGRDVDVRLIGIDTPETVHPSEPVECFGRAASDFTHRRLQGEIVTLRYDVERTDRYGRTLAYVYRRGRMFNRVLVSRGFAQVYTYPPNIAHAAGFVRAQRRARRADRGLWSGCPWPRAETEARVAPHRSGACDPAYRGACVPLPPPDLDCGDVAASYFRSVGSDPHGLDADADGVACEA